MDQCEIIKHVLTLIADGNKADVPKALKNAWKKYRKRPESAWLDDEHIVGFEMDPKITDDDVRHDEEDVLRVTVDEKVDPADLEHPVPDFISLPGIGLKIPTDVEAEGQVSLDASENIAHRPPPAKPGYSIGHPDSGAGTFGCVVTRDNELFILSNSHVIANYGRGKKGKDPVLYPAVPDGGRRDDKIGTLVDFAKVALNQSNLVDAAIAQVRRGTVRSRIPVIGLPRGVNEDLAKRDDVQIYGRTSSHRRGRVTNVDKLIKVPWRMADGSSVNVMMKHQVKCTRYSDNGDSGSVVVDDGHCIVGLHFAHTETASYFTPIRAVLDSLKVKVVTRNV